MNILGIVASSKVTAAAGDYESIATVTVGGGGAASVTFSSIPATYAHLQVRGIARKVSASYDQLYISSINGGGSAYSNHQLYTDGATVTAANAFNISQMSMGAISGSTQTSGIFGVAIIDILDYANTSKYKTFRSLSGVDGNGSGYLWYASGLWQNTAAITSFSLTASVNFDQYSTFALYGIKGA